MTVDECIEGVMSRFPKPNLAYYEEVHQHLAPLARDLENDNAKLKTTIKQLEEQCIGMKAIK